MRQVLLHCFLFCCLLLSSLSKMASAQQGPSHRRFTMDLGYSMNGSGDYEGGHGGFGVQQSIKRWFSIQYQIQFTIHSGSAYGFVRDEGDWRTQSVPMYFVIAGVQLGVFPTLHVFGNQKQWLNVTAGPLLRFQVDGSPLSYSYRNNLGTTEPDYYVIKETKPKVWTAGYFLALESHFVHRPKWSLGIRGQIQNDTNGDMIAGFGLVWHRKLFACVTAKKN